jgi:hypothetical protein
MLQGGRFYATWIGLYLINCVCIHVSTMSANKLVFCSWELLAGKTVAGSIAACLENMTETGKSILATESAFALSKCNSFR